MKIKKVNKAKGEFAKKGEDIKPNYTITILDEGTWIEGQYGEQLVIKIKTRNGERNVNFNQSTINILHDELGDDTKDWVGKDVVVRMKKDVVAGVKRDIYYFVTPE